MTSPSCLAAEGGELSEWKRGGVRGSGGQAADGGQKGVRGAWGSPTRGETESQAEKALPALLGNRSI